MREVWVADGFDGAAIWSPPGEFRIGGGEVARMMTRMLGAMAWTWSSNRRNLSFYYRQGFEVLEERPFVKGAPPIFPIRREPRPPEL